MVLAEDQEIGGSHFALKGDVGGAHRRVLTRREDHGRQACQLRPGRVWLNQVGTFGIGSAAYWWSRLIGGPTRLVMYVIVARSSRVAIFV